MQDADAEAFAFKLKNVFAECRRILRDSGILVFTYHHSRVEGWAALIQAILGAGFSVVNAHPVKAEMSVATPKSQAKEPIQLDIIIVCKKREKDCRPAVKPDDAVKNAIQKTRQKIARLESIDLKLSENDRRVSLFSQFISEFGRMDSIQEAVDVFRHQEPALESAARTLENASRPVAVKPQFRKVSGDQISLEFD